MYWEHKFSYANFKVSYFKVLLKLFVLDIKYTTYVYEMLQRLKECLEFNFINQRPNLKNLSRGFNLRRGSKMVGFTLNCFQYFKIQASAQLKMLYLDLDYFACFMSLAH